MIAEEYPMFDIEYVFLQIRSKSVGEKTKLKVLCPDDGKTYADAEIDLSKIEVYVDDDHSKNIMIDEEQKIRCRDEISIIERCQCETLAGDINIQKTYNMITNSIDQIYEGEKCF